MVEYPNRERPLGTVIILGLAVATLVLLAVVAFSAGAEETRSTVEYGPDLAVSAGDISLSKPVLLSGVSFNLSVKVYNLGDEDASGVTVDLLVDTEPVDRKQLDSVAVDSWEAISFNLDLGQGYHELGILVDADDLVDERREDNNDATVSVQVRGLPDAQIGPGDIWVSNEHPEEGDVLTISAKVRNLGESAATLVVVQFWDGPPGEGLLITNRTTSIPEGGVQTVTTQWDTSDMGGTHDINVFIARVMPGEDVLDNNWARITVLVFTHWDLVIDSITGDVTIDQEWTQDGFVTVREGATLTISGVAFEFLQEYANQFAVFIEDGGSLVIDSALVRSDQPLLVILEDGTSLLVTASSELRATVLTDGDTEITIEESILDGGIFGNATSVTLVDALVQGAIELGPGTLAGERAQIDSIVPCVLSGTKGVLIDSIFAGPSPQSVMVLEGASLELRNVSCQDVFADETSKALVFRRVEVQVVDESSLVVPGASIEVLHFINRTVVATTMGGDDGMAEVEVLSDVIEGTESHFIGNYLIRSTFANEVGTEPLLLTPFPAMNDAANLPKATVVLPPVDPTALVDLTKGDMELEPGEELTLVADFVQDGNIIVRGTLTVASSTLSVLQDRDHQFFVMVEGNGKLVLQGGELTSEFPINVYLFDDASLVLGPNSKLDVNALVTEDGATVAATSSVLEARLLLRGGQVTLDGGCYVTADTVVIEVPLVTIQSGVLMVERFHVDSPATAIEGIDLTANEVNLVASFANVSDSNVDVTTLSVRATILTVTRTHISALEPLNLSVATFYMDASSTNVYLWSEQEGSKVYMYDAQVPRPFLLGNATVLVYWYLTTMVTDLLGNPVSDAQVQVAYTTNGTAVASGVTNDDGEVRLPLLGSIVDSGSEYFVGNYKVVVTSPKDPQDTVIRYVNLDQAKQLNAAFDRPMVPPTMIAVDISVHNTTIVAGTTFNITGAAVAVFPTVRSALTDGEVEILLWTNGSSWSNATVLDASGTFRLQVTAPSTPGVYYVKALVTPTGEYTGVGDGASSILTLEVVPTGPESLWIVLMPSKIDPFTAGGNLVIRGMVRYNDAQGVPAPGARLLVEDPISTRTYQTIADGVGSFQFDPIAGPAFKGIYDYFVTAEDEDLGIETEEPFRLVVVAVEETKVDEDGRSNLLLFLILIIVVAVAVVGGVLGYWAFSSKGRMVECGECGTLVPETATECPKCGIEFEVEVAKCSVCESWIKSDAQTCPYCNTPFKSMEGIGEEGQAPPPGEGGAAAEATEDLVLDVGDDEASHDESVMAEGEVEVPPEAVKKVPEGLRKEVRPRPVVAKKAVVETPRDTENGAANGQEEQTIQRPRVKKVLPKSVAPEEDPTAMDELKEDWEES